jgi:multiple sugar transport system permease protein
VPAAGGTAGGGTAPADLAVPPAVRPAAAEVAPDVAGLGRARAVSFLTPALALIAVFLVFPAAFTLYIGITNYQLTGAAARSPRVVWLANYREALTDPGFRNALWLTIVFVLGSAVIGQNALGFALAWVLRRAAGWLRRPTEALVLLAWVLPGSVVAFLWIALLDRDEGTLNALLHTPGTAWLVDHPMAAIIVFNIWRGTAFSMLLYGAALAGVPPSHLETARLAGSSGWQTLRDVVFPHVRGHALTNTLLITLWTFNDFSPYLITAGGPNHRTETLPVYVYNTALSVSGGRMGYGAAVSVLILVVNLLLALFYLRLLRVRGSAEAGR